jgi:O-methyltransferase involved in polyketide biosynthesis
LSNCRVADRQQAQLGAVQETLFIPLAARARETRKKRAVLRDPKAVEMVESIEFDIGKYSGAAGGLVIILRTAIFDSWVRSFVAAHPGGTAVELGTGLNTRFERVDNGAVHWIDLDLPDTIELRRRFFADTERRQMIAASLTDEAWLQTVADSPGPYFFVCEGVLAYLTEQEVTGALRRIAERFPGAYVGFDTYSRWAVKQQHRMAARRNATASLGWACDDPRSLERLGLRLAESTAITQPPAAVRAGLPAPGRYLLPLADRFAGRVFVLNLFRADSLRPGGVTGRRKARLVA